MRSVQQFTSDELEVATDLSRHAARTLVRKLIDAGRLEQVGRQSNRHGVGDACQVYRLVPGTTKMPPEVDETYYWQLQAWQAMRIKRRFTADEILRTMASGLVSRRSLATWIRSLSDTQFIRSCNAPIPGQATIYQIQRDQPEPPHIRIDGKVVEEVEL